MKGYFNTTKIGGSQLEMFSRKAGTQGEIILAMFKRYKKMSASKVLRVYPCEKTPITSIRRALTVLTSEGKLIKTREQAEGDYGRKEYIYQLKIN